MEHTEKAVEFAASIAKIAKEVGVTTDFIQKFNFAAHQNEIDINAADASLKA
jgi:glutamine synthetase